MKDKWKHLKLSDANVKISLEDSLIVETDKIALFVDLFLHGIEFSKRGFILLPGETAKLDYTAKEETKLNLESIKIFMLNNYLKQNDAN